MSIKKKTFVKVKKHKIHYILKKKKINGPKLSVVFLHGYGSDLLGKKAIFIEELRKKIGFEYLRLDFSGHGSSSGELEEQRISDWVLEGLTVLKKAKYPLLLIGSSLGGWVSFLINNKIHRKVFGIIGIAAAADFTDVILKKKLDQKPVSQNKNVYITNETFFFSKSFLEDGQKHLILKNRIKAPKKVVLYYGQNDHVVTVESQLNLLKKLDCNHASLIINKTGDHSLSSKEDLIMLKSLIKNFIKDI